MSREVRRVPLDFDWPLEEVWEGYLTPEKYRENPCPDCDGGWSKWADHFKKEWYGYIPWDPEGKIVKVWTADDEPIQQFARRNVERAPEYFLRYTKDVEKAVRWEAKRLARECFTGRSYRMTQQQVDWLAEADRLRQLTHDYNPQAEGKDRYTLKDPPVRPLAEEVNRLCIIGGLNWHMSSSEMWTVMEKEAELAGEVTTCVSCDGQGSTEAYGGQRAECEAWYEEDHDPPTGEGWQYWETVSEGSPISPVFATAEELAQWLASPAYRWGAGRQMSIETARKVVDMGWVPSGVITSEHGVLSNEQAVEAGVIGGNTDS